MRLPQNFGASPMPHSKSPQVTYKAKTKQKLLPIAYCLLPVEYPHELGDARSHDGGHWQATCPCRDGWQGVRPGHRHNHTTPHHTIPHHIIPHHTTPHLSHQTRTAIPCRSPQNFCPELSWGPDSGKARFPSDGHTTPNHTKPHHTKQYHTIPHHTTPYHTTPYHTNQGKLVK